MEQKPKHKRPFMVGQLLAGFPPYGFHLIPPSAPALLRSFEPSITGLCRCLIFLHLSSSASLDSDAAEGASEPFYKVTDCELGVDYQQDKSRMKLAQ